MLKAVIFDMDGIIIDSEPIYHKVEMSMFKELGLDLTDEHRYMYVGIRTVDMWQELKQRYDIEFSVEKLVEIEAKRISEFLESQKKIKSIAGIKELLEELQNNSIKIALASSSSIRDIETVLNKTGFREYFNVIVSGDYVKNGKPAPDIFELAVSQLNNMIETSTDASSYITPENCIVIEDAHSGVRAAKAAGIKCIAYRSPNSGNQDLSEADLIIDSFYELSLNKMISLIR
ncbi:MAG TPA: HAD family phosphatase [Clostridiales bacterium]|nr:HAD family phosphatase [Clostridiales bacterium]